MLDVSVSYNRYKFIGYEFLTWLWFIVEKDQAMIRKLHEELLSLDIGNRIVLENRQRDAVETVTIKGDDAGLEEGLLALKKGAVVSEMNLAYKSGEQEWSFTLKAESFHITSLKCPSAGPVETEEDVEGAVLEKMYLCDKVTQLMDSLFKSFMKLRLSGKWGKQVVPLVRQWIHA